MLLYCFCWFENIHLKKKEKEKTNNEAAFSFVMTPKALTHNNHMSKMFIKYCEAFKEHITELSV